MKSEIESVQSKTESSYEEFPEAGSFEQMKLSPKLLQGIYGYGFEQPSIIQRKAILPIISKRDVIAQAQAGTGKTGAFCIGALGRIDENMPHCQALILSPTRQLSSQTATIISILKEYTKVNVHSSIGGMSSREDRKQLKEGSNHIVIGTPGRIIDNIGKEALKLSHLKLVIVDEADQMLGYGFIEQLKVIFGHISSETQICLFSATMPPEVLEITEKFMKDPYKILISNRQIVLEGIKQYYVCCEKNEQKLPTMVQIYKNLSIQQSIIFANTKERVEEVAKKMRELGFPVSYIHSDLENRQEALNQFRLGRSRIMVSSDLLGRGIDIQQVNLVFNYDMPAMSREAIAQYAHRIGRCGRYGRKGIAINLVTEGDAEILTKIKQTYNTTIENLPLDLDKIYH